MIDSVDKNLKPAKLFSETWGEIKSAQNKEREATGVEPTIAVVLGRAWDAYKKHVLPPEEAEADAKEVKHFQLRLTETQYVALERIARAEGIKQAYWVQPLGMKIIDRVLANPELLRQSAGNSEVSTDIIQNNSGLKTLLSEIKDLGHKAEELLQGGAPGVDVQQLKKDSKHRLALGEDLSRQLSEIERDIRPGRKASKGGK